MLSSKVLLAALLSSATIMAPRWRKLVRDRNSEKERIALMLAAITVSLVAVGAVLGGYGVLTGEITVNYLGTHPAAATLELPGGVDGGVDAAALALARRHPAVRDAEARDVLLTRAYVDRDWRPLLLFVIDDFEAMRLNTFTSLQGAWSPAAGSMSIEHTAISMLNADIGGHVLMKTAHGAVTTIPVTGMLHDPGLAPAWQEREGYGYITRATLAGLGGTGAARTAHRTARSCCRRPADRNRGGRPRAPTCHAGADSA